jgi:hemoglobin
MGGRIAGGLLAGLVAGCLLAGCAETPRGTLHERMGGAQIFDLGMDHATTGILADPRVNRRFAGAPPAAVKDRLGSFICLRAGGGCAYHGHDMMTSHRGMAINDAEFDAMVEIISGGFARAGVRQAEVAEMRTLLNGMRAEIVGK